MQSRRANPNEYDLIYRIGFDAWGDGQILENYLEGCRNSAKYQKGTWYVLADDSGAICSSLIRYALSTDACGIGSIATPPQFRNKGYATRLVIDALATFEGDGFKKAFLFSDIGPRFYEKFGFVALPHRHQNHESSVCMVRGIRIETLEQDPEFEPPEYF